MKRSGTGAHVKTSLGRGPVQLKPFSHVRDNIHGEPVTEVVGLSILGDPIYVSKSFAVVGNSTSVLKLPPHTILHSLGADDSILFGLCDGGSRLFLQKMYSFGVGIINSYVDLPCKAGQQPAKTALIVDQNSKAVLVAGTNVILTISIPCRPFGEERIVSMREGYGEVDTVVHDASGLCTHVVFTDGPWLQALGDGNLVERNSFHDGKKLIAADIMRGIFVVQNGIKLSIQHGAIKFELPSAIESTQQIYALWGSPGKLYLQFGTQELVPALTTVEVHTGVILDTLFPTGVSSSTLRAFQRALCVSGTLVYNNGVYRLE